MKIYFKSKLSKINSLIILPSLNTEQVIKKLQELGGIKPYNMDLHKVNTSCKCEKCINEYVTEDITSTIQSKTKRIGCRKNGSNDLFSNTCYLFNEVKFKQLKQDLTSSFKVELKSDLPSYLGKRQGEGISMLLDKMSDLQKDTDTPSLCQNLY